MKNTLVLSGLGTMALLSACATGPDAPPAPKTVTVAAAQGTVTAVEETPGKIRVHFEPNDPRAARLDVTAYQTTSGTVVWAAQGDHRTSKVLPRQVLTPESMASELAQNLRQAGAQASTGGIRPADFGYYWSLMQHCERSTWLAVVCLIFSYDRTDNSDCDMQTPEYTRCVQDHPEGANGACRCVNCQNLCDAVVVGAGPGCYGDLDCPTGSRCNGFSECVPSGS